MERSDYTLLLLDVLVPERVFNVRGLCRMHGLPDITEHLERLHWIAPGKDGQLWTGPMPQGDEEITKLAQMIGSLNGKPKKEEAAPKPAPKPPERKKMTIITPEQLRPMLKGLDTWNGTEDERYVAMLKELIEARSVAFTILPWKYKLPYAVVPVCKSLNWVTRAKGAQGTAWMGPAVSTEEEMTALASFLKIMVDEHVQMLRER